MHYPTPRYSFLAFQLNSLLDQGVLISIEDAKRKVDDGTLIDWLAAAYGGDPHYFDASLYDSEERASICGVFGSLADAVDEKRKLGVTNNGIALCLAYCVEVMQHPDAYGE